MYMNMNCLVITLYLMQLSNFKMHVLLCFNIKADVMLLNLKYKPRKGKRSYIRHCHDSKLNL